MLSLFILNGLFPASEISRLKLHSEGHVKPSPLKRREKGGSYPLGANSDKLYHFEMLIIRASKPEDMCLETDEFKTISVAELSPGRMHPIKQKIRIHFK